MGLRDADVHGDGNCLLYAAMGCAKGQELRPSPELKAAASSLRARAVAHARSLPLALQISLGLVRPGVLPGDDNGNAGEAYWSLAYQAVEPHYLCDNMLHSIATVLGVDIAVATTTPDDGPQDPQRASHILNLWRAAADPAQQAPDQQTPHAGPEGTLVWERSADRRQRTNGMQTVRERLATPGARPLRIIHSDGGLHFRATAKQQLPDATQMEPLPTKTTSPRSHTQDSTTSSEALYSNKGG